MSAVSVFLAALLNHSLQIHLKTVVNRSLSTCTSTVPIGPGTSQILLHSCPGFTQRELIPLILNIFGGVLEPFQVFRCQASTTQEKLALFLKRAAKFQIPHLIVEVNKLPFHLQEVSPWTQLCDLNLLFFLPGLDAVSLGNETWPVGAGIHLSVFAVYWNKALQPARYALGHTKGTQSEFSIICCEVRYLFKTTVW